MYARVGRREAEGIRQDKKKVGWRITREKEKEEQRNKTKRLKVSYKG